MTSESWFTNMLVFRIKFIDFQFLGVNIKYKMVIMLGKGLVPKISLYFAIIFGIFIFDTEGVVIQKWLSNSSTSDNSVVKVNKSG